MKIERRFVPAPGLELRVVGEGNARRFKGYAAVFSSRSVDLGGFVEEIEPGFFDAVLGHDVRGLFNHRSHLILGRTSAGTMALSQDERGLAFDISDPGTSYSLDLARSIARRDVTGSSFAFSVRAGGDEWTELGGGRMLRRLLPGGAASLLDVGPVTFPAYEGTDATVAARSLERWQAEHQVRAELELRRRRLALAGVGAK